MSLTDINEAMGSIASVSANVGGNTASCLSTPIEDGLMDAIKGKVKAGRLELDTPPEWPDGTDVLVEPSATVPQKIGIDECQWRDDPDSLADWDAWIKTIEPLEFTPDEAAAMARFDQQMRQFNIEAVGHQMHKRNGE